LQKKGTPNHFPNSRHASPLRRGGFACDPREFETRNINHRVLMDVIRRAEMSSFITADGSRICEILHPCGSTVRHQSLAEATLPVGAATREHYHARAEEIYYVLQGEAVMRLNGEERPMAAGDAVAIPPGHRHKIWNTGSAPLIFLCCCAPAYEHEDTIFTEHTGDTE
jgi:mannose-6-phosphate isomerase-like protein (cupin superfamily)